MHTPLPCSAACERNRQPILEVLQRYLSADARVLEIGSGTGQHAVYFGDAMPGWCWQTSDLGGYHAGIRAWIEQTRASNVLPPLQLDVHHGPWPAQRFDAVFSANTLHIMSWDTVRALFAGIGQVLHGQGLLIIYGPFHYQGRATSEGNAAFDAALRQTDPARGVRDFEDVDALARGAGLQLRADIAMPANNRCLVWRRG